MSVARRVTPYPYASLPRIGRREARALAQWLRSAPLGDAVAGLATELLGTTPRLEAKSPKLLSGSDARPGPVCVVLEPTGADGRESVLVDFEVSTARALVDRVLGGDGAPGTGDPTHLDELSRGVLGYLASRLLGAEPTGLALARVTMGAPEAGDPSARRVCWPLELTLGAQRGRVRVWLPVASLSNAPPPIASAELGRALARLPLALVAHAGHVHLSRQTLASLEPGDAIVLDSTALTRRDGGFEGELELHLAGARRTRYRASLTGRELTLVGIECTEEPSMGQGEHGEGGGDGDAVQIAGDAPVELCVELARFVMPLEELASLRSGQVLFSGRAIGEHVTLRAGDRALARGELVDVEGELGVRLSSLADGETEPD